MDAATQPTPMRQPADTEINDEPLDAALDAALAWQVRLNSGTAAAADRSAYAAWQLADPRHRAAALQAEQLWHEIGDAAPATAKATPRPHRQRWAIAACFVLAAVGGMVGHEYRDAWFSDYHSPYGQTQTVTLSDGSTLQLDANTAVDVDFSQGQRRISVRKGQVHATVARDAARPFDVVAHGGTVRALGTAFNVRRDTQQVQVTVTEHVVRVSHPRNPQRAEVHEGQSLRYGSDGTIGMPAAAKLHTVTAWQRGYLAFDGAPLAEVIEQVRHYRRGFIVVDPAVQALPLTGVFRTNDTDALLAALPQTLPVRVRRLPGLALIEPAYR